MRAVVWLLLVGCAGSAEPVDVDTEPLPDTGETGETAAHPETGDTAAVDTGPTDTHTDPPNPCVTERPVITLGRGESVFEPVVEGQDLFLTHGLQGGWHHTLAFTATHVPQFVVVEVEVIDVASGIDATEEAPFTRNRTLVSDDFGPWAPNCSGYTVNIQAVVDPTKLPDRTPGEPAWMRMCGETTQIVLTLREANGRLLGRDTLEVTTQPDPSDGVPCW